MTAYHQDGYQVIVADPPWHYEAKSWPGGQWNGRVRREGLPYPTLSLDEIHALPISDLAAKNARLFLWTPNRYVRSAYDICEGWGFDPSQLLVWCKPPMGLGPGGDFSPTAEFILYGKRGTPGLRERVDSTWWLWPRRRGAVVGKGEERRLMHSAKPEAFLDLVEQVSHGPYLELFARRQRLGWDTWGNEALEHVEITA